MYAFISYVHEDEQDVVKLAESLKKLGIHVWLDRHSLTPGRPWETALHDALKQGTFFIACFSETSVRKIPSYMDEELKLAASILASQPADANWFIPVKLSPCNIPALNISHTKSLKDIQWVDLYQDWNKGVLRIVQAINPIWFQDLDKRIRTSETRSGCIRHINSQIQYFQSQAVILNEVQQKWANLVTGPNSDEMYDIILRTFNSCTTSNSPVTNRYFTQNEGHKIIITASPRFDDKAILRHLDEMSEASVSRYGDFIASEKRQLRGMKDWTKRDLAHWIFSQEASSEDMNIELLYLCSYELLINIEAYQIYLKKQGDARGLKPVAQIFPTSLISAGEYGQILKTVLMEDARST